MKLYIGPDADAAYASHLEEQLELETIRGLCSDNAEICLQLDGTGLSLVQGDISMQGDFTELLPRIRQKNLEHELLIKATKPHALGSNPTLLDATAGMGEDSLILAAAGFHVTLFEYDPVIAALLGDALRRGADHPQLAPIVARMDLHVGDSIKAMRSLEKPVDVILLDPMFPARSKSGLIKKKFQLLQQLESPCEAEDELLSAAISAQPRKIVIKRPAKGELLGGLKPDYSIGGKAIRYDCMINISSKKLNS